MTENDPRSGLDGAGLTNGAWSLSGQWNARPGDEPGTCTERMLACVNRLAELDPLFAEWYYDDDPIELTPEGLRERFEERWPEFSGEGDEIVLTVWNGVTDDLGTSRVSLSREPTGDRARRGLEFVTPVPAVLPGLYRLEPMLGLFEILLTAWNPQWCGVQPRRSENVFDGERLDVFASWIVYLEPELYEQKRELPAEVGVRDSANGRGRFFILAPTPEDVRLSTVDELRRCLVLREEWGRLL